MSTYIGEEYFEVGIKDYRKGKGIGEEPENLTDEQLEFWLKGWMSCFSIDEEWGIDNE